MVFELLTKRMQQTLNAIQCIICKQACYLSWCILGININTAITISMGLWISQWQVSNQKM